MQLAKYFRGVVRHEIPSAFIFHDARTVVNYLNSNRAICEPSLPEGVTWEDFIMVISDQIRRLINHFGELTVNRLSGVLMATDSGSFATNYFLTLDSYLS